ncbi:hypothetical protein QQP08_006719 [Theobroma cacao]|nr:hypothetical protein QQP08_006719 [Theobroma cacao]
MSQPLLMLCGFTPTPNSCSSFPSNFTLSSLNFLDTQKPYNGFCVGTVVVRSSANAVQYQVTSCGFRT